MKTTIHPEDILRSLGEALITADTTGVITWLNPLAENLVGVRAEDLRGKHLESILKTINLPDIKSFDHLAEMILQKGKVCFHGKEVQLISRGKSDIQVSGSAVPVINSQGVTTGVVISFQDTTLTNYAGENLLASEARFSKLFNSNPAPLGITRSSDFRIVAVNDVWCRLTGYSREEVLGRTSTELGIARPQTIKQVRDRLEVSDSLKEFEISLYTRNGEEKLVLITSEPVEFNGETFILNTLLDVTERKQAEHKIRESEQRFRSLYENATIGMYRTTPNGRILLANPALVHMLGYSSFDELKARSLEAEGYEPSYERSKFKEQIERNHEVHGFESAWTRRDGTAVFVRESAKAIRDEEGHTLYYEGTVEDITERKLTEEALQENERKLSTLLGNLSGFAYRRMNDRNWTMEFISGGCEAITGYKPGDFLGNSVIAFNDIINPADREMVWEKIQESILLKESYELEYRIIARDKAEKWVWEHGRSVYSNDRFEALEGYITDITGRKLAEEKVRNTENWYRSIIENAPDGFVIIDIEGRYKYASPSVERLFGYVQEDIPYLNSAEMTHPDDLPAVLAEITKLLHDPAYIPTIQYRFLHKNGSWRWIESTINNLLSEPGVAGIIINFRDIHERKLADAELKRNQELLKEAQKVGHIGHMEWNGKDQPLICSDELYRLLELEPQSVALTQYKIAEFLTPEEAQRLKSLDRQFFANQTDIDYEFFIKLPSGKQRWLHQHGSVQYSDEGKAVHMISTVQDITDRKLAEDKLHESEEMFRTVYDNSPVAIELYDHEGILLKCNKKVAEMFGVDTDTLIGKFCLKDDPNYQYPEVWEKLQRGEVVRHDIRFDFNITPYLTHKSGIAYYHIITTPIRYEISPQIGYIVQMLDVTERHLAEAALMRSEHILRLFVEHSPAAIAMFDTEMRYIAVSHRYISDYRLTETNLEGLSHYDIFPEMDEARKQVHRKCLAGEVVKCEEDQLMRVDGTLDWVRYELRPWYEVNGSIGGLIFFSELITEQKQAEVRLRESEERFRTLYESSGVVMLLIEPDTGRIEGANDAAASFYGYTREQLVTMNIAQINQKPPDVVKEERRQAIKAERNYFVFPHRLANGDLRTVEVHSHPITRDHKALLYSIIFDITERRQAEEKLRIEKEKLDKIAASVPGVMCSFHQSLTGQVSMPYASPASKDVYGFDPKEIADDMTPVFSRILPEDMEHMLLSIAESGRTMEIWKDEFRYEHPLKGQVWIEGHSVPVREADGSLTWHGFIQDVTERKQAEITLRESEKKYRDLINSMNDAIYVINHDLSILDVNKAATRLLGYSHNEFLSKKIFDIDVNLTPEQIKQLAASLPDEKLQVFETVHKAIDGRTIPVEISSGMVSYNGREVILSITRDITERKKVERELQESEEKFRKAFMTSRDSININRLEDGLYIAVNQGFTQITGFTEDEVVGKTSLERNIWVNPDDRKRLVESLNKFGHVENMEALFRKKDGGMIVGLMSASIIMLNNVPHLLNVTRDITERKHVQMALLESEEKYRTLTESFESIIVTVDADGVFHYANQAAARAYDMTPEALTGKSMYELFPPEVAQSQMKNIREVISSRKGKVNEAENVMKGEQRWLRTSIQPLVDASGNVNLALVNSVDITDRKRVQLEIQQKNEDLQFINTLNEAANRGENIRHIARTFASQSLDIFNSFSSAIYLVSEDDQFLELIDNSMPEKIRHQIERVIGRDLPELKIPHHRVDSYRELFQNKKGILFTDQKQIRRWISGTAETPSLTPALRVLLRKFIPVIVKVLDIHSAIVIPLTYGDKVIGTLEMYSHGRLQEPDLLRMSSLSTQVTAAIVRKQAEERLRESLEREQFLGDLLRNASVAIGVGFQDGSLGMSNLAFQQLTGYTSEELRDIAWNQVLTPPEWLRSEQKALSVLNRTKHHVTYEKEYIHKDGHRIPVELVVHPFIGIDGKVTHYYAFITDITERKKAVEDLRKSEEKYRLLFEKVKNGYTLNEIITDENGVAIDFLILEGNTEVEEVFGMKKAELINKKGSEIRTSYGTEWAKRLKICADAALHGSEGSFEIIRFNTGRHFNVHVYSPARNYFAAIYEDVTEKKNIEGALKQVEEKYFALFNSKTDITLLTEISDRGVPGRIIEANDQAVEITGYPREELLRLTPSDVSIYPLTGSEEVAKQFLVGNTARIEHTIKCRVGRDFPAEIVLYKIMSGDRAYAIIAVHDITEVKRAEKEAEESRRLVNALMNNVPLGVTIVDTDINVIWRSQAGEAILGISEKDSIRKSVQMLPMYHPETKTLIPYDEIPVVKAVRNDILVENVEVLIFNAQGAPVHMSCNAVSVKNQSGEIIGGIMTYQDITSIKKREEEISGLNELLVRRTEELETSNKELEAFSYSVSHDLRAPLRHISGFSRLLSDRLGDKLDTEGANYLHRVNDAANLMSTLINDILKLSRVTRSELTITKVNLSDLVKTVSYDKQLAFPDRKINILIRDNLYADCDVSLMRICLNNLFENAWKFTMKNENPVIEFGKVTKKGKSCFFIRDNGVGFDMKYADKLFGAFQRLHSTSEFEGTGIGLAIVQRVISKHGGSIWAESEINKGTTFYFTLTGLSNGEEKINTAG